MKDYFLYTGMDNKKDKLWYFWILDTNLDLVYRSESIYQWSINATDAGCEKLKQLRSKTP